MSTRQQPALAVLLLLAFTVLASSCPDDSSLTNCSKRNKPQYWDGKEWTCRDRR